MQSFSDIYIIVLHNLRDSSLYWSPFILGYILWELYMYYINYMWITAPRYVLLEIKMPKIINKSPKAMEVVFDNMHQTGEGNLIDKYILGRVRSWHTLELVSIGGQVKFYSRMEVKYRAIFESAMYAQYPDVEIVEAEDYTKKVPYLIPGNENWDLCGVEYKLTQPDAYPIKTYVDYGLDKDPKEEFKVDPLTPVIEFLGSMGPSEQLWIQISIMASKNRFKVKGSWFKKQDWTKDAKDLITELKKEEKPKEGQISVGSLKLSPGERSVLEAVERGLTKYGFDCGIRTLYLAPKDKYKGINVPRMLSVFKQFGSTNLNGITPNYAAGFTSFDYPWQDFKGMRVRYRKKNMFDAYIRRSYFYQPHARTPFVLNTEELATLFHIPGEVAVTPTLERIPSRKAEPPANLPV